MIFSAAKKGVIDVWQTKRIIIVYYMASLLTGLLVAYPFSMIVGNFAGNSLMGKKLGGGIDFDFLFEFLGKNSGALSALGGLIIIAAAAFALSLLFLSGGALTVYVSGERYSPGQFWGGAAHYFGRFFRLMLWSLPLLAVFFCLQFLETLFVRLFFGSDPYQSITYWGGWVRIGLAFIGILLYYVVFDYARIHVVVSGERKMRLAILEGIKFAFRHFFSVFLLALLLFVSGLLLLAAYNLISDKLTAPSGFILLLLIAVQQLYVFFRMYLRLTLLSGQLKLYSQLAGQIFL